MRTGTLRKPLIAAPWVIVSAGFHEQGGQAKAVAALADYLLSRGNPVHLVAHEVGARFAEHPRCRIHLVARPGGSDFFGVWMLRRISQSLAKQLIRDEPGTRVIANGGSCPWADVNWVHYVHAAWTAQPEGMSLMGRLKDAIAGRVFRRQERLALRAARIVVTNSERTRREVIEAVGVTPERVRVVYYGGEAHWRPATPPERSAARAWLGQKEGRPLVVFVGGFGRDERKGFDTLWRAWQELCRDATWDVDLVAAGDGASYATWRDRVAGAGLSDRVRLIGFTERIYDVLAAADLLVSPVRYEPYGLNVQEALCREVPALVSACAGVAEQYPPELSELVLPVADDWKDLVQRLRHWRAHREQYRTDVRGLAQRLRSRGWEEMAEEIVAVAETLAPGVVEHPVV